MERYSVSVGIQSKCEKMQTRITSNTDTFYAVQVFLQIICDDNQTLLLFPREQCCFDIKSIFRKSKMAAIKTLTDTKMIFKKDITFIFLSAHTATISKHYWTAKPHLYA